MVVEKVPKKKKIDFFSNHLRSVTDGCRLRHSRETTESLATITLYNICIYYLYIIKDASSVIMPNLHDAKIVCRV